MRVSADDRIDVLRQMLSEIDDFACARALPRAVAECTRVGDDDDHVGSTATQQSRQAVDDGSWVFEAQSDDVGGAGRRGGLACRETDDTDLHTAADDDRVAANPWHWSAEGVAHVRAQKGVVRLAHACAQRVLTPIEFVIAERRGGETESIEDLHHRSPEREIRSGRTLKLVAAVEKDRGAPRRHAVGFGALDGG